MAECKKSYNRQLVPNEEAVDSEIHTSCHAKPGDEFDYVVTHACSDFLAELHVVSSQQRVHGREPLTSSRGEEGS